MFKHNINNVKKITFIHNNKKLIKEVDVETNIKDLKIIALSLFNIKVNEEGVYNLIYNSINLKDYSNSKIINYFKIKAPIVLRLVNSNENAVKLMSYSINKYNCIYNNNYKQNKNCNSNNNNLLNKQNYKIKEFASNIIDNSYPSYKKFIDLLSEKKLNLNNISNSKRKINSLDMNKIASCSVNSNNKDITNFNKICNINRQNNLNLKINNNSNKNKKKDNFIENDTKNNPYKSNLNINNTSIINSNEQTNIELKISDTKNKSKFSDKHTIINEDLSIKDQNKNINEPHNINNKDIDSNLKVNKEKINKNISTNNKQDNLNTVFEPTELKNFNRYNK